MTTVITAVMIALAPFAQAPAPGDQCMNWHATTQDNNGNTMVCVHRPDTGHIMYWEPGTVSDYPGY